LFQEAAEATKEKDEKRESPKLEEQEGLTPQHHHCVLKASRIYRNRADTFTGREIIYFHRTRIIKANR
jgi:hypothetical protein